MSPIPDIRPGQSVELLKELHILTRDGKLNQDSRRKLKQVYHLFQFIEPLLQAVKAERGTVTLVDNGAGDRKRVVEGTGVSDGVGLGGRRMNQKKQQTLQ